MIEKKRIIENLNWTKISTYVTLISIVVAIISIVVAIVIFSTDRNIEDQTTREIPNIVGGNGSIGINIKLIEFIDIFSLSIIEGIRYTIQISFFSILIGTLFGFLSSLLLTSKVKWIFYPFKIFTYIIMYSFLAIPALVVIIVAYYSNLLRIESVEWAATLALAINLSPFISKIMISGIKNIPQQYLIAAKSFCLSKKDILLKITGPYVTRNALQPILVQWFTTIKLSSLASVIGAKEILHNSQVILNQTYEVSYVYIVLTLSYVVIVLPIAFAADIIEKKYKVNRQYE